MDLFPPASCRVDLARGVMHGATGRYEKRLADLEGVYEDAAAFDRLVQSSGNPVVYEVTEFRPSARPGDLIFAEDTEGKGHITRSLRDTRGFVHVAMPDDFDVGGWKLIS